MYGSLQELCELEEKSGKPFWKIVQEDDCREQGITEEVSFEQMRAMYQAMKDADARYDEKLKSESGLVGTEGKKMMEARAEGTLLCGDFIGKVMEKALKTSESNACMKRIVAAPTAGSCGVVPAVFLSLQEEKGYSEEKMVEALFVAAGIGGVSVLFWQVQREAVRQRSVLRLRWQRAELCIYQAAVQKRSQMQRHWL